MAKNILSTVFRTGLSIILSISLTIPVLAESSATTDSSTESAETAVDSYGDPIVTATPVPEHSAYYEQQVETDMIDGWPDGPNIEAQAGVVMDLNTGAVLYAKNKDTQLYPASITKIMTCLLACENLDLNSSFSMSESAAYGIEAGSSTIYADTGEVFTMEQGLMALMLESANEMALEIAELVSGGKEAFADLMNQRAEIIGCTNTNFTNPHGLPDENHYTTAHDMALIAKTAFSNASFRTYCTTGYYEIPPTNVMQETRYMSNHHKMMAGKDYTYDGVLGGKTGYTIAAGNTLVTYAERGNLSVVVVVLNSVNGGYSDTASLLDYAFNSFQYIELGASDEEIAFLPSTQTLLGEESSSGAFTYKNTASVTIPLTADISSLTTSQEIQINTAGTSLLKTTYYYSGQTVGYGVQYERDVLSNLF